jgi:hypothetical protein
MKPDEKCGNCKYFARASKDKNTGECHRHAPRPNPRPKMQIEGKDLWADTQWPKVAANTWCGDFEQK